MTRRAIRVGRLDTLGAIRTELGRLYRAGRTGKERSEDVSRLATVLKTLMECIRMAEIEPRLAALEAQAQEPATVVEHVDRRPILLQGGRAN